jgi:hypothetical protein
VRVVADAAIQVVLAVDTGLPPEIGFLRQFPQVWELRSTGIGSAVVLRIGWWLSRR